MYATFVPSTDYGFLGLSKRERRDRKRRKAQRYMDRYAKCVQKKGKASARCQKLYGKAKTSAQKADAIDQALAAKGKTTAIGFTPTGKLRKKSGSSWAPEPEKKTPRLDSSAEFQPSTDADVEAAYSEDTSTTEGLPSPALYAGAAVLGIGGVVLIMKMLKHKKPGKKGAKLKAASLASSLPLAETSRTL